MKVIGGEAGITSKVMSLVNGVPPAVTPLTVSAMRPRGCESGTTARNRLVMGSKVSQGASGLVEMFWG